MDIALNNDQEQLVSGLSRLVADHSEVPTAHRRAFSYYAHDLDRAIADNGYLEAATTPGMGLLEAVLAAETVARSPVVFRALQRYWRSCQVGLGLQAENSLDFGPWSGYRCVSTVCCRPPTGGHWVKSPVVC